MNLFLRKFLLAAMLLLVGTLITSRAWAGGDVEVFPSPTPAPFRSLRSYSPPPNYFGDNPNMGDVKNKLIAAGQRYRIPPQILFGIAFQESGWRQFRDDRRTVYHLESDGRVGVGIMQMTVSPSRSDYQRLCTDIDYNIDQGAALLITKWNATPVIGDGYYENGREKLENWYYAIWAYNGFICPNYYPETVLAHVANGRGLWTAVSVTIPHIASCPPGKIASTPSPVHIDADFNGEVDNSVTPPSPSSASFDGFDFPFGNRNNTNGWNDANPFKAYCGGGACGGNTGPYHPGEDWNAGGATAGQTVYAAGTGTVVLAKPINLAGRGNLVAIQHDTPFGTRYTVYLHVTGISVSVGSHVQRGQQIASIYAMSTGPHLHFEMRTKIQLSDLYPHDDGVGYYASTALCDGDGFISPTDEINAHRPGDPPVNPPVITTVVDDSDSAGGQGQAGFWKYGTSRYWKVETDNGQKGNMTHCGVNGNNLDNMADWRPNLPSSGRYEVFAFIPPSWSSTQNAPYEIYYDGGATTVRINQNNHRNSWVSLGTYNWQAGTANYVRLLDKTGEAYSASFGNGLGGPNIAFDAVKWEPRGYAVGEGSSRQQLFIDSYNRNGGVGNVGTAINSTHWWGNKPIVIQDFRGGVFGDCAIIDDEPNNLGAWVVRGAMWSKFVSLGGSDGPEGPPRSDEGIATPSPQGTTGAVQTFEKGHIHSSPNGAFFTINQIDSKYVSVGGSSSFLGFPKTDEFPVDSSVSGIHGWVNVFEGGHIFHTNELGTWTTRGSINDRYAGMGSMDSALGFPKTDEVNVSLDHVVQDFEGGSFYSYPTGTFFVVGPIKTAYDASQSWQGEWGWPIRDENATTSSTNTGGVAQDFESGTAFSHGSTAYFVSGEIKNKYQSQGWEHGSLGFPVSEAYPYSGGTRQDFEGGSLTTGVAFTLSLAPSTVVGGTKTTGTLTLPAFAPAGGVIIQLSSSNTSVATVPATITIAAGQTKATFLVATAPRTGNATATITAKLLDIVRSTPLAVNAATTPATVVISQPAVDNSTLASGTSVVLAGQVLSYGHTIAGVTVRLYRYADVTNVAAYWAGGTSWSGSAQQVPTIGTANWSVKVPTLLDGHYSLVATATDSARHSVSSRPRYFFVEATPRRVFVRDATVSEPTRGVAQASFTVSLDKSSTFPLKVSVRTTNGAAPLATAGLDYSPLLPTTITFAPGQTAQTVRVPVLADALDEQDETFRVQLSKIDRSNLVVAKSYGTATIVDSNLVPTLSINSVSLSEGNGGALTNATLTVKLSAPSGRVVTVNFATANGTATAGSDYIARLGSLTFAAGETSKTVLVPVKGDAMVEANENFSVTLSDPFNALLAPVATRGTITITNDDKASAGASVSSFDGAAPSAPGS